MPRMSDMFPSKWLSAADLSGEAITYTVSNVDQTMIEGRDGEESQNKWVVYFEESDKGLVLNKTNGRSIENVYGDDTDDWVGQQIVLYPTKVNFNGQSVACIRVDEDKTKKRLQQVLKAAKVAPGRTATTTAKANTKPQAEDATSDEDIPF